MIFLARAVEHARPLNDSLVNDLERALLDAGYAVRVGGSGAGLPDQVVARENVTAVAHAQALVAVLPSGPGPVSSVWLEIGIAIAADLPIVVLAPEKGELPFLLRALASGAPDKISVVHERPGTIAAVVSELARVAGPSSPRQKNDLSGVDIPPT